MLENFRQRDEATEREKIERVIAVYLGNHLGELFDRNLEAKLPYLRSKLLNLDGYISKEEHEKFLVQVREEWEDKLSVSLEEKSKLQEENDCLKGKIKELQDELAQVKTERQLLAERVENLQKKMKCTQEELFCVRETLEARILERERYNTLKMEHIQCELKKSEDVAEIYREKVDYYKNNYASLDGVYKKYLGLDENIRHQLAGIFGKGDTVQGFFCGAVQEAHLKSLWEFICHGINNHRWDENVKNDLKGIFDFAFDAVNRGSREPTFLLIETPKGASFDMSTMQRTSDSKQLGRVQEVLLRGYKNRVGTVVAQSLVVIG